MGRKASQNPKMCSNLKYNTQKRKCKMHIAPESGNASSESKIKGD
ncbi:hypothetical protein CLOSTMETH_01216 [[Clostridium] methylpentosum DSM 5476]|uniref:Uncharacterized protein n=1 Tax=[Clostridium] methylpentosum DSM 5476 TaxID=537013 RepID=C0EBJ8_9FIRM|nr:hypothetical protein CLOSTMETH_01216 [[Clostridium] methylpentosum DSM 5476]